jgi:hypothetical protein
MGGRRFRPPHLLDVLVTSNRLASTTRNTYNSQHNGTIEDFYMQTDLTATLRALIASLLVSVFVIGCASKINQDNFDQVQPGMTMKEVIAIVGQPTESSSINVGGLSGTAATWKHRGATIAIQFLNDKVQAKQFSRAE